MFDGGNNNFLNPLFLNIQREVGGGAVGNRYVWEKNVHFVMIFSVENAASELKMLDFMDGLIVEDDSRVLGDLLQKGGAIA